MAEASTTSTTRAPSKKKKATNSEAWNHFIKSKDEKTCNDVSICNYCNESLAYNVNNDTSSMWKHLRTCKKYPHNIDKKQKLLGPHFKGSINGDNEHMLSTWKYDEYFCRHMLARMIIIDDQPFTTVVQYMECGKI
ncbi:hypothetical protein RND71_014190 [Anisodus tanguticus]|uniref:BED-type domain-containing protein n=1 Tax=Anisodus tanguticus TaxID=243964 RepID=A0AAE1VNF7_9SOLA|nr:hypothetical protein RND71_014190 [Anisodus tanguticus]